MQALLPVMSEQSNSLPPFYSSSLLLLSLNSPKFLSDGSELWSRNGPSSFLPAQVSRRITL